MSAEMFVLVRSFVSLKLKSTTVSLKGVVVAGLRQILGADLSRK